MKEQTWKKCLQLYESVTNPRPLYSPDYNLWDLSFFSYIDSSPHKESYNTNYEEVNAVDAWSNYDPRKINVGFLTLHAFLEDSMKYRSENDYLIRHDEHKQRKGIPEAFH